MRRSLVEGTYLASRAVLGIRLQKGEDKILGRLTDVLPITFMEDDLGVHAFFNKVLKILRPEG